MYVCIFYLYTGAGGNKLPRNGAIPAMRLPGMYSYDGCTMHTIAVLVRKTGNGPLARVHARTCYTPPRPCEAHFSLLRSTSPPHMDATPTRQSSTCTLNTHIHDTCTQHTNARLLSSCRPLRSCTLSPLHAMVNACLTVNVYLNNSTHSRFQRARPPVSGTPCVIF